MSATTMGTYSTSTPTSTVETGRVVPGTRRLAIVACPTGCGRGIDHTVAPIEVTAKL
jgi:hypothetical protein